MRVRTFFAVLALLAAGVAPAAPSTPLIPFRIASVTAGSTPSLDIDRATLDALRGATAARVRMPVGDGVTLTLDVQRSDLLAPGRISHVTGATGMRDLAINSTVLRGTVAGDPGSIAVIVAGEDGARALILTRDSRFTLSPVRTGPGPHRLQRESARTPLSPGFRCANDAPFVPPSSAFLPTPRVEPERIEAPFPTKTRYVCRIGVEADYEYTAGFFGGDATAATNNLLLLYSMVSAIYERDVNTTLQVTFINLWLTPADPWDAPTAETQASQFKTWCYFHRDSVSRDAMHLMCGRDIGGGYAYYGLCDATDSFAAFQVGPTAAGSVFICAHELGHNFGSPHTQDCFWQSAGYTTPGALLDSCVAPNPNVNEGTCYTGPTGILPPDLGTIMSYCWAVRLEFHNACKALIRKLTEATCLAAATVQPPRDLVASLAGGSTMVNWNPSPTSGVLHYDVYRSVTSADVGATLIGSTTGYVYVDPTAGSFFYRAKAVRASDESPMSNESRNPSCAPGTPAGYAAGDHPVAILDGDFNRDGLADLAVVNHDDATVSILRGQRCGICTTPFAPVTQIPVGSGLSGLAAGDFDHDGVTDLAVTIADSGTVAILVGQKNGQVALGTFVVGPRYAAGTSPAGIVAGDFDEDGIVDLAVVCGSGQVAVLRGLGTDGVGTGAFAAPVSYAVGASAQAITLGDFNSDGIADLAVACPGANGISVLLGLGSAGRGNGTFGAPGSVAAGGAPGAIAAGDFNEDGVTDLAVAAAGSNSAEVLIGQGDGTFAAAVGYAAGAGPTSIAVGDWNQDGIADLALTNPGAGSASLLYGQGGAGTGSGTFAAPLAFAAGASPTALVTGEFTDEGRPDLAVAGGGSSGAATIVPVSCAGPYATALAVTVPAGGEFWLAPGEHAIQWTKGPGVLAVNLELSRDGGTTWQSIATDLTGTQFVWTATVPYTLQAKIRLSDAAVPSRWALSNGVFTVFPQSALGVGAGPAVALALHRLVPNPGRGELAAWVTLPAAGPALLEVLDVAGRRVRSVPLGGLGIGLHRVDLTRGRRLGSGIYLVRLTQLGRSVSGKAVVVQ